MCGFVGSVVLCCGERKEESGQWWGGKRWVEAGRKSPSHAHSFSVAIVVPSQGMECAMNCVSITSRTTGSDPIM